MIDSGTHAMTKAYLGLTSTATFIVDVILILCVVAALITVRYELESLDPVFIFFVLATTIPAYLGIAIFELFLIKEHNLARLKRQAAYLICIRFDLIAIGAVVLLSLLKGYLIVTSSTGYSVGVDYVALVIFMSAKLAKYAPLIHFIRCAVPSDR